MKKLKSKWITKDQSSRLYNIPVPIVGLTGGIATGKTTVAQLFRDHGIPVIDADKLVKTIYQKNESHKFVSEHFWEAIVDNAIHFKTLRELAFKTTENQKKLEDFIYAQLPTAFVEAYKTFGPHEFIVYDVPLLFEKGLHAKIDVSVCAYSPRDVQIERLINRDQIDRELAKNIISKQLDIEEKKNKSDLIVHNMGSLESLKEEFENLMESLT